MKASIDGTPVSWPLSRFFKRSLLCTAVMSAIGGAHAEEVTKKETAEDKKEAIEVIEVRGILASTSKNLLIKRLSNSIVDAITAEDIGKFPDKNVADSLQRVPGIVITRSGGEGANVSVRGLSSDLTFTQLNGNFVASSPGAPSRSFDYSLLPSAMIQRVEVHKSPQASLDEGGVGGTILLHTRKPFDMDANSGILQVEGTYADVTDDYEPQFTGLYSWKNEEENFGFLVGYTRQERTNRSLAGNANTNAWRWTGSPEDAVDVNGNPVNPEEVNTNAAPVDALGNRYEDRWIPHLIRAQVFEEKREREGIQFTTQWAPNDNWEIGFNYFRFELGQDFTRSAIDIPEWEYTTGSLTDLQFDSSGTILRGADYTVGATGVEKLVDFPWIRGEFNREESTSDTYDIFVNYEGDGYSLQFKGGHTESEGGPEEKFEVAYYSSNNRSGEPHVENAAQYAGWAFEGQELRMYMDPNMINSLQNGVGGGADPGSSNSSFVRSTLEEDYLQADVQFDLDWRSFTELKVGVKYRSAELHRETGNTFYLAPDFDVAAGEAREGGITRDDSYQWNGGIPDIGTVLHTESLGNIVGGFNTNLFPAIDWAAYTDYLNTNFKRYTRIEPNFVYDIEENIWAGYVQADFERDRVRGNVGVRVVRTETIGSSTDLLTYFKDSVDADGNSLPEDERFEDTFALVTQERTQTHVLPSFNIAWDWTENVVVRGAIAKTMSRPGYNALGSQLRLRWNSNEYAADRAAFNTEPGWSGSGGNKDLEPFESLQMDLSLEYYYGEGSAVGIALFNKDVDNFVVPLIIDRNIDLPERTITIPGAGTTEVVGGPGSLVKGYSTSANGSDATSRGVEVFIQHHFDSGFGFSANYTYNDTNKADVDLDGAKIGESALIGSADYQFNTSAYFENETFSVRASYNLRGEVVTGLRDGMNSFLDDYDQVDVNASYSVSDNIILTASVINLTKSESYSYLGDDTKDRFLSNVYTGRRFYLGLTYNF